MKSIELQNIIAKGEDSATQFKQNITNPKQLAEEFVAMSNCMGGKIIIGVDDNSVIVGISQDDTRRLNQLISNVASELVKPPVYPNTQILEIDKKNVLVITLPYGSEKPYCTNDGIFITKSGSDKRKMSQGELRRLFQESGKLFADETIIKSVDFSDIDKELFKEFYKKKFKEPFDETTQSITDIFGNLNLADNGKINLAGALLFSSNHFKIPSNCKIIAVSFLGNSISGTEYRDSENIEGNLQKQFNKGLSFMMRNLKKLQNDQHFNSIGIMEIPKIVLEELLANALIHRNYFIESDIRILIFDDRIEIISPGKLPNNLTVEKIKRGVSVKRNPTLASFAFDLIPYRGIGSGILRVLESYPNVEFYNETEIDQFKAIIYRPLAD
ncbi:MAG: RNA-binding domain-containing protein [Bacteroidota bacterium]